MLLLTYVSNIYSADIVSTIDFFLRLFISNKFTIELLKISRLNIKTFLFSKLFEKIIEKILFPIPLGPNIDIIFPSFVS